MLTRRSFLPSFFGGAAAALAPAAVLAVPEPAGFQRLTVALGGATRDYCVRLTESQLLEYQAWLMGLCALATMVKSTNDAHPVNAVSLAEVKAAVQTQTGDEDTAYGRLVARNEQLSNSENRCDNCGWCDEPDDDGSCYNCGA